MDGIGKKDHHQKSDKKATVLVALSGGIDSAISAFLLKKQGFKVIGISFVMMDEDLSRDLLYGCHIESLDMMKSLCLFLEIPFYAVNARELFYAKVCEPIASQKLMGEMDDPCFNCNLVKFDLLIQKAELLKADFIATGHYAKVHFNQSLKQYQVYQANDREFDQSHLLARLDQHHLDKLMLPLGELRREEILKLYQKFKFEGIKESQQSLDCFHQSPRINEFIEANTPQSLRESGDIIKAENEVFVADHEGVYRFTLGQAYGQSQKDQSASVNDPFSVIKIDPLKRIVWLGDAGQLKYQCIGLKDLKKVGISDFSRPKKCFAKLKDQVDKIPIILTFTNNNNAVISLTQKISGLYIGQIIVLYNSDGHSSKILASGSIAFLGDNHNLNRAEAVAEKNQDDDGRPLPSIGADFAF